MRRNFRLDAIVTVVDAKHVSTHLDAGDESVKQLAFADVILLNKTDLVSAPELDALESRIRGINAVAALHRTQNGDVPLDRVLDIGGFSLERATAIDPKFLEPEYPFEWAGAYKLPVGTHAMVIGHPEGKDHDHGHDHGDGHHHHHHGNEDELDVALMPLASLDADAISAARDSAVGIFSDWEKRVNDGESISVGAPLNRLLLKDGNGTFTLPVEKPGFFLVFEGCGEEPLHIQVAGENVKPSWQADYHLEHEHNEGVSSVGIQRPGELDGKRLNEWISGLLRTQGNDIYRMKGVLNVKGTTKRLVFQGIHMLFDAKFDREWGDEPRVNTLVFIGRKLDRAALTEGFKGCIIA
jgi:G3E family GTPase